MKITICHDENFQKFLASKGFMHQASGISPVKQTRYWVYNETETYNNFKKEYEGGGKA